MAPPALLYYTDIKEPKDRGRTGGDGKKAAAAGKRRKVMKFSRIIIRNFKSIREMEIREIENALILVGKNNTGKTSVLDAIRMLGGVLCACGTGF